MTARRLMSASRAKTWDTCPRKHFYAYELGAKPARTSDALRFGTLTHAGLEQWWKDYRLPSDERLRTMLERVAAAATPETDRYELAAVRALLTGYHYRWLDQAYETCAVEREFSTPLRSPTSGRRARGWDLAGKLDAVAIDAQCDVWIVEHKTTSLDVSPGSDYWAQVRLDGQISAYYAGAAALGYKVRGCLYDVIHKPALRPYQANKRRSTPETPEEYGDRILADILADAEKDDAGAIVKPAGIDRYYARATVVRLADELDEYAAEIWARTRAIDAARKAGIWPRNTSSCNVYNSPCAYRDVCAKAASIDDETRFRRGTPHAELATVKEVSL